MAVAVITVAIAIIGMLAVWHTIWHANDANIHGASAAVSQPAVRAILLRGIGLQ